MTCCRPGGCVDVAKVVVDVVVVVVDASVFVASYVRLG